MSHMRRTGRTINCTRWPFGGTTRVSSGVAGMCLQLWRANGRGSLGDEMRTTKERGRTGACWHHRASLLRGSTSGTPTARFPSSLQPLVSREIEAIGESREVRAERHTCTATALHPVAHQVGVAGVFCGNDRRRNVARPPSSTHASVAPAGGATHARAPLCLSHSAYLSVLLALSPH